MAASSDRNLALGVVGFDGRIFLHALVVLDKPRGDAVGQVDRDVIELSGSQVADPVCLIQRAATAGPGMRHEAIGRIARIRPCDQSVPAVPVFCLIWRAYDTRSSHVAGGCSGSRPASRKICAFQISATIRNCRTAYWPPRGHDRRRVSHTWRPRSFLERRRSTTHDPIRKTGPQSSIQDIALIVGGGPGIGSSARGCSRRRHACRHRGQESRQIGPVELWRRRTACVDMRAMQANQRPWICCSRSRSRPWHAYASRPQH